MYLDMNSKRTSIFQMENLLKHLCHPFESEDVEKLLVIISSTAPNGSDIRIQLMSYIYSADGTPVSSVSLFGIMKQRLHRIEEIGRNVERILGVMTDNFTILKQLRTEIFRSLQIFPEPEIRDFELPNDRKKFRTQQLQQALAVVEVEGEIDTFEVEHAFDLEKNRFYFNGTYPFVRSLQNDRLLDMFLEYDHESLKNFMVNDFDRILSTMKYPFDFFNGLLDQFQSVILSTYSLIGVRRAPPPPPPSSTSSSSSASAFVRFDVERDAIPPPPMKKYRKRLPDPIGFEPEYASSLSDNGRRINPCPPQLPSLIAMFLKCVELTKYRGPPSHRLVNQRLIMKLFKILPEDHEVKQRLRAFCKHDYQTRYVKSLVQIFVNYASRDKSIRKKRITDIRKEHIDLVREEYIREHERVRLGGAVPTFEELTKGEVDLDSSLHGLFQLEDFERLLDEYAVNVRL